MASRAVVLLEIHQLIEQAVAAGCHVLSQKPFATDLATARRLVASAEAQGVKLAVQAIAAASQAEPP